MFQKARLKLTAWYLLMIMLISAIFSLTIYEIVSHQIEGIIHTQNDRLRHYQEDLQQGENPSPRDRDDSPIVSTQELENQERKLLYTLLIVNGAIFIVAGGAGYFLAGRTLQPIRLMIDEQNQFISSASHELRTPLAVLQAEMEGRLLEKHISDKQARDLIKSNLEEVGTLRKLTNNLLRIAHIHNVQTEKYLDDVIISDVIQEAVKKVSTLAKKKDISISAKLERLIVLGEKDSFREVFVILLDNAIKYSPQKSKVTVIAKKVKHSASIIVSDEGVGISEKDLPRIFDRFYRADKSRSQADGYGLGLSIAKKVIEKNNGSITVISKENKGTAFTLRFPLKA